MKMESDISYLKKDIDSFYVSVISVPAIFLVSGDLSFFAIIVENNNMSGHWCHWCMLSLKEWGTCGH